MGQERRREGRACLCFACLEEDGHVARWALSNSDGERELSCLYNDRKSTSGYFSLLYCCCYLHYHHLWAEDAVAVHHALMFRGIPPSACLAIPLPAPTPSSEASPRAAVVTSRFRGPWRGDGRAAPVLRRRGVPGRSRRGPSTSLFALFSFILLVLFSSFSLFLSLFFI